MATALSACSLYVSGLLVLGTGIELGSVPDKKPVGALERARARGEAEPGIPRLHPFDPMANAAILMTSLDEVELARPDYPDPGCRALPRNFSLVLDGKLSKVRFSTRAVCQLRRLKEISVAQPGFGRDGLGEVAAFILGKRVPGHPDVDVSRIIVPPFAFSRDTLTFLPADLGPLLDGEEMIGTYHTHPGGDQDEGLLSDVDLGFMRHGRVDFHGQVGALQEDHAGLAWLFDIVEPRHGDWNVFAHDRPRLDAVLRRCEAGPECPLDDLRVAGSPSYLLTRYYDERDIDF
jgi:hypothetical protein